MEEAPNDKNIAFENISRNNYSRGVTAEEWEGLKNKTVEELLQIPRLKYEEALKELNEYATKVGYKGPDYAELREICDRRFISLKAAEAAGIRIGAATSTIEEAKEILRIANSSDVDGDQGNFYMLDDYRQGKDSNFPSRPPRPFPL